MRRLGPGVRLSACAGTAWVVTRYPDGTEVHAHPRHGPEDEARAVALGYVDVDEMTLDHDRLHSRLAAALGLRCSPTLWALAHGEPAPACAGAEEALVLAAQRFLNLAREA